MVSRKAKVSLFGFSSSVLSVIALASVGAQLERAWLLAASLGMSCLVMISQEKQHPPASLVPLVLLCQVGSDATFVFFSFLHLFAQRVPVPAC